MTDLPLNEVKRRSKKTAYLEKDEEEEFTKHEALEETDLQKDHSAMQSKKYLPPEANNKGNHKGELKKVETSANDDPCDSQILRNSYWLTRIVIVRYMGFIYFVAFLISLMQNKQLVGKKGLLPADVYLSHLKKQIGTSHPWTLLSASPTLFWFVDFNNDLDFWLDFIAWSGLVISACLVISGAGNWFLLLLVWIFYHSLANIGQRWFSFGWESQLLETGFLTIFLCPMLSMDRLSAASPPSRINIFAYRWLIFRIMLGAGLIKIRGDKCWRDLTCMNYHYETQPVPNPVSYFLHQSPEAVHKFEVLSNHFIELLAPFLLLLPFRRLCILGGAFQIFFQIVLIISGNLSFLNWLTILPSLACFDDASLAWMFSDSSLRMKLKTLSHKRKQEQKLTLSGTIRKVFNLAFGFLIAYLSIPVVQNLVSSRQVMNTSFSPLRIVNTYGAFGSVTKKRTEVVMLGTNSSDPDSPKAVWEEYEFNCKPGELMRRPCLISPYHYRLDWLMWFAAFQNYQHNPWLLHLAGKFLVNDEGAESLIAHNPFQGKQPPRFVKADHYRYTFPKLWSKEAKNGYWWKRKKIGQYFPPVSLDMLHPVFHSMGWSLPTIQPH